MLDFIIFTLVITGALSVGTPTAKPTLEVKKPVAQPTLTVIQADGKTVSPLQGQPVNIQGSSYKVQ